MPEVYATPAPETLPVPVIADADKIKLMESLLTLNRFEARKAPAEIATSCTA